jgi:hypothetical protein
MRKNIYSIPPKIKKILIVAGNYQEFKDFCDRCMNKEFVFPGEWAGTDFIYYDNMDSIRGLRFDDYYLVGTYKQRKDFQLESILSCIK